MKRVLFITHRLPYPPDKGDRVRAFHELRALSRSFSVTLASLTCDCEEAGRAVALRDWCQQILLAPAGGASRVLRGAALALAGRSMTEGYFWNPSLMRRIRHEHSSRPFDLVMGYCSSVLPYVLGLSAPRVLDLVDVDSAKWADYAAAARRPLKWLYRLESRGVRALERRALWQCDAVVCISRTEAANCGPDAARIVPVGNGVDLEYFAPRPPNAPQAPAVVFTGQMDYRPNVDGVCWFVREVWPALRLTVPELTFTIVGRNPVAAVRRLESVPGVRVTGAVPDVRPYLGCGIAVAPIRLARGMQNKVLEAMAMECAVVASPAVVRGLEGLAGDFVIEADHPRQWQRAIAKLVSDRKWQRRLGHAARRHLLRGGSWESRMAALVSLCESLAHDRYGQAPCPELSRPDGAAVLISASVPASEATGA